MVNCKECARYCCKYSGGENITYTCPAFMPKKKGNADMVEVIRCKDCKYWNKKNVSGEYPDKIKCLCIRLVDDNQIPFDGRTEYTAPDDYCSRAERIEKNRLE